MSGNLITAIDLGSAKTSALVAEVTDSGLRYVTHATGESRGSRKGVIVDLERAIASVQKVVEQAEDAAGAPIESAVVGVGGANIRGINTHGGMTLGSRPREISREDIRLAVERARNIAIPADRQILHLLPQEFILDDQHGIHDPIGMMASKLEVRVHVVTASASATQNVITTLNRAGIHVSDTIFEPLACADSVLRPEERDLGVCLADMGAGSTDLIVYHEGAAMHTGAIPIGGDHFTNDVAVGLTTPLIEAEKIKKSFGCAVVTRIPETNEIEVPSVGDRPARSLSQRALGEVIEPRARELFEMTRDHLRQSGMLELCSAGVVLTGGAAKLPLIADVAESLLRKQIRIGAPAPISKLPAQLAVPEFATTIGLVVYAYRARKIVAIQQEEQGITGKLKAMFVRKGA